MPLSSFVVYVECMAMMDFPPGDICEPCTVSDCPPVPDHCRLPTVSDAHWPVRSISRLAFTETNLLFLPMVYGSLVNVQDLNRTDGLLLT